MSHLHPRHKTNARGRVNIGENGQRIWKRITIRVIMENGKGFTWQPMAAARTGYSAEIIQEVLEKCSEYLEKKYPNVEFRLVELEPNRFNLVYDHDRVPQPRSIATQELLDEARRIIANDYMVPESETERMERANPLGLERAEYPGAL